MEFNAHDKDIVAKVRSKYPKYDKYLHSKVKRPDEYGVCLVPEAEKLISGTKPCAPVRADKHRIKYSISMRTTKTHRTALQQAFKRKGYTMQAGIEKLTDMFLEKPDMLPER